jgi:hypothetical protein
MLGKDSVIANETSIASRMRALMLPPLSNRSSS